MEKYNYFGSAELLTSVGNEDLIVAKKTSLGRSYLETTYFQFYNVEDCVVQVNSGDSIFIGAGEGMEFKDEKLDSFKIISANVQYRYTGRF